MFIALSTSNGRLKSSFISGEGLATPGGSEEAVKSDIDKIHQENVERLSRLSASEVMQEKDRIEKTLGEIWIGHNYVQIQGSLVTLRT